MQTQIEKKEVQERFKFSEAQVRKLLKGNRRYYRVDSEVVGLRIYVDMAATKPIKIRSYTSGIYDCRNEIIKNNKKSTDKIEYWKRYY